jgi:hypothetical protein
MQRWGFDNAQVIKAVATDTTPVVCHKDEGLKYYSLSTDTWFPVGLGGILGSSFDLTAGSDIVLASTKAKVGYLHHGESKDDGKRYREWRSTSSNSPTLLHDDMRICLIILSVSSPGTRVWYR